MNSENPVLRKIREAMTRHAETRTSEPPVDAGHARLIEKGSPVAERLSLFKTRAESSGAIVHILDRKSDLKELLGQLMPGAARVAVAQDQDWEAVLGPDSSWFPDSWKKILVDPNQDRDPDADSETSAKCGADADSETVGKCGADADSKTDGKHGADTNSKTDGKHGSKSNPTENTLFQIDIALTRVEAAVAETGSIVLDAGPTHARLLSLTAEIHVAILKPEQIVPDLLDWTRSLEETDPSRLPTGFTLISGPSKTADIELQLVTGVHGPGALHIVVIDF